MTELETYAAIAEIFGGLAILGGALFAMAQISEFRRGRREQVAAELCRGFSAPHIARGTNLLKHLPDGISAQELRAMDETYEEAAQTVAMTFETMGLLVHMNVASFTVVQELTGGLLLMMWRKIAGWVYATRIEQGNPRFAEWMQWLAERVEEREGDIEPAFTAHADWTPRGRR